MVLYYKIKWDVKNDFAYVLQFFSFISDNLGSVRQQVGVSATQSISQLSNWIQCRRLDPQLFFFQNSDSF